MRELRTRAIARDLPLPVADEYSQKPSWADIKRGSVLDIVRGAAGIFDAMASRPRIVLWAGRAEHFPQHTGAFVRSGCEQQGQNRDRCLGPGDRDSRITLALRIWVRRGFRQRRSCIWPRNAHAGSRCDSDRGLACW